MINIKDIKTKYSEGKINEGEAKELLKTYVQNEIASRKTHLPSIPVIRIKTLVLEGDKRIFININVSYSFLKMLAEIDYLKKEGIEIGGNKIPISLNRILQTIEEAADKKEDHVTILNLEIEEDGAKIFIDVDFPKSREEKE